MQEAIEAGFVMINSISDLFRNAYGFVAKRRTQVLQILVSCAAAEQLREALTEKPIQSVKRSLASGGRGGQAQPRLKSLHEAAEMA